MNLIFFYKVYLWYQHILNCNFDSCLFSLIGVGVLQRKGLNIIPLLYFLMLAGYNNSITVFRFTFRQVMSFQTLVLAVDFACIYWVGFASFPGRQIDSQRNIQLDREKNRQLDREKIDIYINRSQYLSFYRSVCNAAFLDGYLPLKT